MSDILKITLVFVSILALLRLKWNIGYVLLAASGLLALLYLMPVEAVLATVKSTLLDLTTIKLLFSLTLIRMLELVLRERDILKRMTDASRVMLKNKKAVIISMPMLIGMLPSLGGAYFSAPMVDASAKGSKMTPEEKGFINYWFRHPWEYILPLYPGVLLASAITGLELRKIIMANMLYAIIILITGFMFSMRSVKTEKTKKGDSFTDWKTLWSFLPIISILLLVMIFHVELPHALGIIILMLFVFYRYKLLEIVKVFHHGFTKDVIVLIFGTMLFKFTMEGSGAVSNLSRYFTEQGIPLLPILIILPFISGILTGITVGFVGSTFPLLINLTNGAHLNEITLAFASGFVGVLLSPVHLCLVLTREYFKADMWGIYKKTIPGCVLIMAGALALYFILR